MREFSDLSHENSTFLIAAVLDSSGKREIRW